MSERYFTISPAVEAEEHAHRFTIYGVEHAVVAASEVLNADHLDRGIQVLFDHAPGPPEAGTLLDLECGWDPITPTLAGAAPGTTILAANVNERSLALTTRNAAAASLGSVHTSQAEAPLAELRQTSTPTDLTWSNPPVCIGKDALHELLLSWLALLSANDEAWLIVPKNLGASSLATWLGNQGWGVNRMASSKDLRVLRVYRRHG